MNTNKGRDSALGMTAAKERVEQFRTALNDSLNGGRLELLDKWVDLSVKLAKLILLLLSIVVWFPLLSGLEVGVPLISTIVGYQGKSAYRAQS